eukprot:1121622-Amphidinium_carterae.3
MAGCTVESTARNARRGTLSTHVPHRLHHRTSIPVCMSRHGSDHAIFSCVPLPGNNEAEWLPEQLSKR